MIEKGKMLRLNTALNRTLQHKDNLHIDSSSHVNQANSHLTKTGFNVVLWSSRLLACLEGHAAWRMYGPRKLKGREDQYEYAFDI